MAKSIHQPEYEALMAWLRKCRKDRHLTVRAAGELLARPHTWVSKVETCERRLDVAEFVHLCRVLEVDPIEGIAVVQNALGSYKPAAAASMKAADGRQAGYRVVRART